MCQKNIIPSLELKDLLIIILASRLSQGHENSRSVVGGGWGGGYVTGIFDRTRLK